MVASDSSRGFVVGKSLVGVRWSVLATLRAANTDHDRTPTSDLLTPNQTQVKLGTVYSNWPALTYNTTDENGTGIKQTMDPYRASWNRRSLITVAVLRLGLGVSKSLVGVRCHAKRGQHGTTGHQPAIYRRQTRC